MKIQDIKNEVWKSVPEFEHIYQVSNLGRIKSIKRIEITKRGKVRKKERILNPSKDSKGYLYIKARPKGANRLGRKNYRVHRFIMFAFYGVNNLFVDHINKDRADNRLSNLRYVTHSQNLIAGSKLPYDMSYINIIQAKGNRKKRYQLYIRKKYYVSSVSLEKVKKARDKAIKNLSLTSMDITKNV